MLEKQMFVSKLNLPLLPLPLLVTYHFFKHEMNKDILLIVGRVFSDYLSHQTFHFICLAFLLNIIG